MGPVFSLVLDEDVSDEIALRYPELYKDLVKVINTQYESFFIIVAWTSENVLWSVLLWYLSEHLSARDHPKGYSVHRG